MSIENIKPMDVVCKTQKIDRCRWDVQLVQEIG